MRSNAYTATTVGTLASNRIRSVKTRIFLSHLLDNARDGVVILMHDAHPKSPIYTETFLSSLDRWGFQCVTVEELFSYYGIPLKPNHVYKSCEKQAREP